MTITAAVRARLTDQLLSDIQRVPELNLRYDEKPELLTMIVGDFVATLASSDKIDDTYIEANTEKLGNFLTKYLNKPAVSEWLKTATIERSADEYNKFITRGFAAQLIQENKDAIKHGSIKRMAATKIQAAFKGHSVRTKIKEAKEAATKKALGEAATKIQAAFRGHAVRKKIKEAKEAEEAATKIQALYRGHVARGEVKKQNEAATKIQAAFRGHAVRTKLEHQKINSEVQRGVWVLNQLTSGFFTQSLLDGFVDRYAKQHPGEVHTAMMLEQTFITAAAEGNIKLLDYVVFTLQDRGYLTKEFLSELVANGFYEAAKNNNMVARDRLKELAAVNPALLEVITKYDPAYDDVGLSDDVLKALQTALSKPFEVREDALEKIAEQSKGHFLESLEVAKKLSLEDVVRVIGPMDKIIAPQFFDHFVQRFYEQTANKNERREALQTAFVNLAANGHGEILNYVLAELNKIGVITPTKQAELIVASFLAAAQANNFAAVEKLISLAEPNQALIEAMGKYRDDVMYGELDGTRASIDDLRRELSRALAPSPDAPGTSLSAGPSSAATESTVSATSPSVDGLPVSPVGSPVSVADIGRASPPSLRGTAAVSDHLSVPLPLAASKVVTKSLRDEGDSVSGVLSPVPDILERIKDALAKSGKAGKAKAVEEDRPLAPTESVAIDHRSVTPVVPVSDVLVSSEHKLRSIVDSLKDEFNRAVIEGKDTLLPHIVRSLSREGSKKDDLERLYINAFMQMVNQGKNNKALSKLESLLIEIGHKPTSPVIKAIQEYKGSISSILSSPSEEVKRGSLARLQASVRAKIAAVTIIGGLKPAIRGGAGSAYVTHGAEKVVRGGGVAGSSVTHGTAKAAYRRG
jgi:hypothetical protein